MTVELETSLLHRANQRLNEMRLKGVNMEYTPGIADDGEEICLLLARGPVAKLLTTLIEASHCPTVFAHAAEALLLLANVQIPLEKGDAEAVIALLRPFYLRDGNAVN